MSPNLDSENVGAALGRTRRLSREGRLHVSYGLAAAGGRPEGVRQVAPQLRTRKGSLTEQQPWAELLAARHLSAPSEARLLGSPVLH